MNAATFPAPDATPVPDSFRPLSLLEIVEESSSALLSVLPAESRTDDSFL